MDQPAKTVEKKLKSEELLIWSVVEKSKEIILIKFILNELRKLRGLSTRIKYRPPNISYIRDIYSSYELRIQECMITISTLLKTTYTKDGIIVPNNFYLSLIDMETGYVFLEKVIKKDKRGKPIEFEKVVLFLSKNEDAFLEVIYPGEIHAYSNVKDRLIKCKSVLDTSKIKDVLLLRDPNPIQYPTQEFITKYKETED